MLFFIVLLSAIAIGVIFFMGKKKNDPIPAIVRSKPLSSNHFKEEFAMEEKETKIIKERVKTAENAKIERIAAAKVDEEIGEELAPLKSQLQSIQNTLNQFNSGNQQSTMSSGGQNQNQNQSNELLSQMQQFSSQAQQQQQKTFQQLQQSVHQAAQMLNNVEQSIQSVNMLNQITQQINQSQQQLQQQQQQQQNQGQAGQMNMNMNNQSYQQ
jgi:hypothetical protein